MNFSDTDCVLSPHSAADAVPKVERVVSNHINSGCSLHDRLVIAFAAF